MKERLRKLITPESKVRVAAVKEKLTNKKSI